MTNSITNDSLNINNAITNNSNTKVGNFFDKKIKSLQNACSSFYKKIDSKFHLTERTEHLEKKISSYCVTLQKTDFIQTLNRICISTETNFKTKLNDLQNACSSFYKKIDSKFHLTERTEHLEKKIKAHCITLQNTDFIQTLNGICVSTETNFKAKLNELANHYRRMVGSYYVS